MQSSRWLRAVVASGILGLVSLVAIGRADASTATAPTISGLKDQFIAGRRIGPLLFTVGDDATPAEDLIVTAHSSDQAFVADDAIIIGGSGSTRSLLVADTLATGTVTITVSVSDGTETTSVPFAVTLSVNPSYYLAEGATGP